jgi:glycosyltransferase involved in cell wall biosynthesis
MRVCVVAEHRFRRTPDGRVWTDGPFARPFWDRYLDVFDEVGAVARVLPVPSVDNSWVRADGDGVSFAPVTYYHGLGEFALKRAAVRRSVQAAVKPEDAVILRVPSTLAMLLFPKLRRDRHPYAVEAVGDPYDVFGPGGVRHPLRPYLRWQTTRAMQRQCRHAVAATYVTAEALQRRYPPGPKTRGFYFSDVQLGGLISNSPRQYQSQRAWTLITVGSLGHLYKAPDIQIAAIAECRRRRLDVRLQFVGDGIHRSELEEQARALGIASSVHFLGQLPAGAAIGNALDQADVFLLPSRQEGLPRAMIEAMARGLPCIGSHVGGIPELIPPEDRVAAGDAGGLADKIQEIIGDPARLMRMSQRNLERARDFTEAILRERRLEFYRCVRDLAPQPARPECSELVAV